ncbi:hypothetical protein [Brachyspira pilosicoli]|nr:hypothetical protein [Brachyspira pilosicoli]
MTDKNIISLAASKLSSESSDETTKSLAGYILAKHRYEKINK